MRYWGPDSKKNGALFFTLIPGANPEIAGRNAKEIGQEILLFNATRSG
jgi:hypothetical protein